MNKEDFGKIEESISNIKNNKNNIYFLTYDTRNNPRASIKHIYDIALTLKENGFNSKILVENKSYVGVNGWLGDVYNDLDIVSIKDDAPKIKIEDIIVIPEYYSNVLEQLSSIKCVKIMLIQQKNYIFENLPVGSKFSDFGVDRIITTTDSAKKYLNEYFPEMMVYIVPPIISDLFKPSEKLKKPFIGIHCRDRNINRKIISEFYLKFPYLRWITFKDLVNFSYEDFANNLKECYAGVWVDDESTFGTFPIECMKSNIPIIGKIPNTVPDWMKENNGGWVHELDEIPNVLGSVITTLVEDEDVLMTDEIIKSTNDTVNMYNTENTKNSILKIFVGILEKRTETLNNILKKQKENE